MGSGKKQEKSDARRNPPELFGKENKGYCVSKI